MNRAPAPFALLSFRMGTEPLACPYCNALVPVADAAAVGRRIPCPRCGEAFTLRQPPPAPSPDLQSAPVAGLPAVAAANLDWERRLRSGRNNRILAGAVLGVMGVMAAVGLAYALYTVTDRRAHDTALPPPPRRSPLADLPAPAPVVTPPAALAALRWLPADCTLIAGVQLTEMRQTDEGRDLLNHLFRIGKWEINADLLERWTGLKAREIDHLVVGVQAEDGVPPPAVLVVRTVRPYDADAVKTALDAEPSPNGAGGKALYQGKPRDGGFRPVVWFADERTLVIALTARSLEAVPDRPAEGLQRLPAEVRDLLENRLLPGGPAWVVGHSADWRRTGAALLLEKDAEMLGHVRDFAFQMQAERPATLTAFLRCDGEKAARALEDRLAGAKPAGAEREAAHEGPVVTLQLRGDPATLWKDLGK